MIGQRWQLAIQVAIPVGIMAVNYFWEFPQVTQAAQDVANRKSVQAVLLYWCTSNVMSLAYAGLFSIPSVKKALGIPSVKNLAQRSAATKRKRGLLDGSKFRAT